MRYSKLEGDEVRRQNKRCKAKLFQKWKEKLFSHKSLKDNLDFSYLTLGHFLNV